MKINEIGLSKVLKNIYLLCDIVEIVGGFNTIFSHAPKELEHLCF